MYTLLDELKDLMRDEELVVVSRAGAEFDDRSFNSLPSRVLARRLEIFFEASGWTWFDSSKPPTRNRIQETILRLAEDLIRSDSTAIESGRIRLEPRRDEETGVLEEIEVLLVVGSF